MKTYVLNLFIVDDDNLRLTKLKNYLDNQFGTSINISIFKDSESMLKKIERYTNIVIADFSSEAGKRILNSIKEINPKTEVIMLSNEEDIALEIENIQVGSINYIIQGENFWYTKSWIIKLVSSPIRLLQRILGTIKFRTTFL